MAATATPTKPSQSSNLNASHPAIKRIMREMSELQRHPSIHYTASPCDDNLFDWHFTVRGMDDSDFQGGRYV
jgi:ubiquitin-conjugating enzyme E2 J1